MRKIIIICISFVLLNNCTDEADEHTYTTRFKNEASSTIEVKGYDSTNNLIFDEIILKNDSSTNCSGSSESFPGISCKFDSLVVRFDNDKGYICVGRFTNIKPEFCFSNEKSPFGGGSKGFFTALGNYTYEFVITQEDFENAHDLP